MDPSALAVQTCCWALPPRQIDVTAPLCPLRSRPLCAPDALHTRTPSSVPAQRCPSRDTTMHFTQVIPLLTTIFAWPVIVRCTIDLQRVVRNAGWVAPCDGHVVLPVVAGGPQDIAPGDTTHGTMMCLEWVADPCRPVTLPGLQRAVRRPDPDLAAAVIVEHAGDDGRARRLPLLVGPGPAAGDQRARGPVAYFGPSVLQCDPDEFISDQGRFRVARQLERLHQRQRLGFSDDLGGRILPVEVVNRVLIAERVWRQRVIRSSALRRLLSAGAFRRDGCDVFGRLSSNVRRSSSRHLR
ncbi:hypothetical protein PBRA_002945 [Plasmodiophora brassicae]|uniref:Uncharacterized protein n=1 Tax=Plasmodiophora brassicae TaxID=37360 RepID=A0A0G4J6K3_PLABS|nr:hypothetical protein PBRA_002945 [Plasmodiophora brassicae]